MSIYVIVVHCPLARPVRSGLIGLRPELGGCSPVVIAQFQKKPKSPYVCPGCSNHQYSNNMINRWNVSIKQSKYLLHNDSYRSKNGYIKVVEILSIEEASISVNRWRDPPSTPLLDPAETPGSNLPIHLKQQCRQVGVDLWLLLCKWEKYDMQSNKKDGYTRFWLTESSG
jgi:hypothetical protein